MRFDNLRIKHLRLIELAFSLGSLHRAATALHISQPSASAMVRDIETALGCTLFERSPRGVTPTPQGIKVLERCRLVLREARTFESLAGTTETPTLRIGAIPRVMQSLIPATLARLAREPSNDRYAIVEGNAANLVQDLCAARLDCVVGRVTPGSEFDADELSTHVLYAEPTVTVVSTKHRLATKRRVSLVDLQQERWVLPSDGSFSRETAIRAFVAAGLPPIVPWVESSVFHSNLLIVSRSDLVTVAPAAIAQSFAQARLIKVLPLQPPLPTSPIHLIARRALADYPPLQRFAHAVAAASKRLRR
ncbi:MAG TPA: LysR family transcriptional regulator [Burkholderiales bacterium]|jgi:DNA-binding transcriptional LysR family regulator|nr:LysR family transcriptional regulator [Burkholderiales bacterium]